MLGSFWTSRRDTSGGDTTPKAPVHSNPDRERNPFEASLSSSSSAGRHSRKNSATTTGANSNSNTSSSNGSNDNSNTTHARDYAAASPAPLLNAPHHNTSTTSLNSSLSNLSSSTGSSSSHGGQHQHSLQGSIHHGHHGLPAGLRTPTLQKSFVLPEVISSVNATGLHAPNTSSKTAAAALHQSPMLHQGSSSGGSNAASSSSNSGRNTPTRTAHSHTSTAPYPNPKEHSHTHGSSPKSKQPDFKLSQPPDSKNSPSKTKDKEKNGTAPSTPVNPAFSASSSVVDSPVSTPALGTQVATSNTSAGSAATNDPRTSTLQTSVRKRENHGSSSLKGKLTVKIIEARNLVTPEANIRPYVVATFEQNEFVSREAINEHEEDARGEPVSPRTSSHLRSSQRGPKANGGSPNEEKNGKSDEGDIMDTSTASAYHPVWKHEVAFDVTLDHCPVTICVYARRGDEEFFLGLVDVKPELKHGWQVDDWYKLNPRQDEEVTGDVHIRMRFERSEQRRTLRSSDFEFLRMIGKGTFGRVFQVRKKDTKRIYAMKVLSKREIIAKKEVQHTIGERKILQRSSECPFLLGLKFSFQSETELFLVMDFKSGGELFHHLQKEGRFTEDRARFYAAEITLAFEYLHKYHIVYRDLKPENILLDATGHIVLCDFGLSKPDLPSNALTNTFCGTTEYLAPEVLLDDHGYSQTVDFWSLGVLLFEMCCGWSPFYAEDTQQMYKNICFGKIKFPRGVIGDDGKQFVKGLLNRNPAHRLGAKRDAAELKEHPFFKMIDWEALAARQVTVPFKPYVDSDECVRNFDAEFTDADVQREAPVDTGAYFDDDVAGAWIDEPTHVDPRKQGPVPIHPSKNRLDEEAQDAFRGFSYSGDGELNDLMMSASVRDNDDDMRS